MKKGLGLALIALLQNSACSFVFVSGPSEYAEKLPPTVPVECTTSVAAPVIDGIIAGYQVVRTGVALANDDSDYEGAPFGRGADIAIGAGLTALFVASAIYGVSNTTDCKLAKERHAAKAIEGEAAPAAPPASMPQPAATPEPVPPPPQAPPAPAPTSTESSPAQPPVAPEPTPTATPGPTVPPPAEPPLPK